MIASIKTDEKDMKNPPLIVIQLNEINFDLVSYYVDKYDNLPSFRRIMRDYQSFETFGEEEYHWLEPWIHWVSAQTGKDYSQHGVFRLGDIMKAPDDLEQVFEVLEKSGLRVGAISPMNARNRLSSPAFFIPDPWTETESDGSGFSRRLSQMLRQTVNENATGRISAKSLMTLAEAIILTLSPSGTKRLLQYVATALSSPWYKSLVLDQLIHLLHRRLFRRGRPDVSFVFFNAGAHIQHHYMHNSKALEGGVRNPEWYIPRKADPVHDMLKVYDGILGDYLDLQTKGTRLLVATGLSQIPYDRVKFYYRLKNHAWFLDRLGIEATHVAPRMTRDFEASFQSESLASDSAAILAALRLERDGAPLFGDVEVRGNYMFASLTYPDEIRQDDVALVSNGDRLIGFGEMVAFVAIKNGMHTTRGYGFLSPNATLADEYRKPFHIAKLFDLTISTALQLPPV